MAKRRRGRVEVDEVRAWVSCRYEWLRNGFRRAKEAMWALVCRMMEQFLEARTGRLSLQDWNTRSREAQPQKDDDSTRWAEAVHRFFGNESLRLAEVDKVVAPIQHLTQLHTWDCGIACLQMVVRWLMDDAATVSPGQRSPEESEEMEWMLRVVNTQSVWTIDLVYLLHLVVEAPQNYSGSCRLQAWKRQHLRSLLLQHRKHFQPFLFRRKQRCHAETACGVASYLFVTTHLGVDETYRQFGYYKESFRHDEVRVQRRFDWAEQSQSPPVCLSKLDLAVVVDLVSRRNVIAIVLLDNQRLQAPCPSSTSRRERSGTSQLETPVTRQDECGTNKSNSLQTEHIVSEGYAGHYVVLAGVSQDETHLQRARIRYGEDPAYSNCFVIFDPGSENEFDCVPPSVFEEAWRADGTDDDIIFVAKK